MPICTVWVPAGIVRNSRVELTRDDPSDGEPPANEAVATTESDVLQTTEQTSCPIEVYTPGRTDGGDGT